METCLNCGSDLIRLDADPNGRMNRTCVQCRAEEDHDFDVEPEAVFDRRGERIK